ncbi:MAG: DivIVA domain-containing protein [Defluviitaleaceae bacterium]|nr:DivIVA domain-containing protein [Defluviitaleaceae bacterium]
MPSFNIVKNGYHTDEVDNYISSLEKTIFEYKNKDAAIANTMINAQIAADNIIRNADLAAKSIKQEAVEHLDKISASLDKQRRLVARFERDYTELVEKYLLKANAADFREILMRVNELDNYLEELGGHTAGSQQPQQHEVPITPPPPIPNNPIPSNTISVYDNSPIDPNDE